MEKTKMRIEFGAHAKPLVEQLAGALPKNELAHFDRLSEAVTMLFVHGYLTDRQCLNARTRLVKRIADLQSAHLKVAKGVAREQKRGRRHLRLVP